MADGNHPLSHKECKNTLNNRFKEYYNGANNLIGVVCSFCLCEWIDRDLIIRHNHSGAPSDEDTEGEIQYGDKTFHLLNNPFDEDSIPSTTVTCSKIDDITDLSVGDHVKYTWLCGEYHHAIIKAINQQEVRLIHLQGEKEDKEDKKDKTDKDVDDSFDVQLKTEVIDEITPNFTKKVDGDIYRCDYERQVNPDINDILAIPRANAWRGEKGYRLRKNNCEDFITFCKTGRHLRFQQERIIVAFFEGVKETYGQEMSSNMKARIKVPTQCKVNDLRALISDMDVGIAAILPEVCICFDCSSIYNSVKKDFSKSGCMERVLHTVMINSQAVFDLVDNPASGCNMKLGLLQQDSTSSDKCLVQFGVFCGGKLFYPSNLSSANFVVKSIAKGMADWHHTSEKVSLITDLKRGDHIVIYKWILHPRCHMIVTNVDVDKKSFNVIRFTYDKGVFEELNVNFKHDISRVIHDDSKVFPVEEVVNRAKQFTGRPYNIWSFNCKHFAFWCKTGNIPSEP